MSNTLSIISTILSALAFLFSIYTFVKNKKLTQRTNELSEIQAKTGQGQLEIQLRELINAASHEITYYGVELEKNPTSNILIRSFESAEEQYRNAYEEACSKYLDGKIDKERFEKMYLIEIQNLVTNINQNIHYDATQSHYRCTLAVYNQWFNKS